MGNCTGVFSNCCGDNNSGAIIKKIDKDDMRVAISN